MIGTNKNRRFFCVSLCTCVVVMILISSDIVTTNLNSAIQPVDDDTYGGCTKRKENKSDKLRVEIGLWKQIPNKSNLKEMALYNTRDLIFYRIAKTGSSVVKSMFINENFVNQSNINYKMGVTSNTMQDKKHNFASELLARENISSDIYMSYTNEHLNRLYEDCLTRENVRNGYDKHCIFVSHMMFIDKNIIYYDGVNYAYEYENLLNTFDCNLNSNLKIQFITFVRNPLKRIESLFYYLRGMSGGWRGKSITFEKLNGNLYEFESDSENEGKKIIMYNSNGTQIKVNKTMLLKIAKEYNETATRHRAKVEVANVLNSTNFYSFKKCIDEMKKKNNNICWLQENYMTKFYCGQNKYLCNVNNMTKLSLNHSISNLNKYFSFIGILEHFDVSIYLLQLKFSHIIKWNRFENIFKTNVKVVLKNTKNILHQLGVEQGYGRYQHSKLIANSKEYQYLVEKNQLDIMLFNYVNDYYEKYIIPSLQA